MAEKEYIERGALVTDLEKSMTKEINKAVFLPTDYDHDIIRGFRIAKEHAIEHVKLMPTADVVEVVRCKACEKFDPHGNGKVGKCKDNRCRGIRFADDFCNYGKRKEQP